MCCPEDSHGVDSTINSQVVMKAIRGLFHGKSNISNNCHTDSHSGSANPAITLSLGHHNISIPSPSGFPLKPASSYT